MSENNEYVFDISKVFPRLKKNWAKDPLNEISLLAPDGSAPNWPSNMVMYKCLENKYVELFMQDMGQGFLYLTFDMLPEGITPEQLQEAAFQNLFRDIQIRICEMNIPGLYGVACGGDFEAETLLTTIWKGQAERLGDDLLICAPAKDMIIFTKANDKKLVKKLIKIAEEIFARNRQVSPFLLYTQDVFRYTRADESLRIDPKHWIRP